MHPSPPPLRITDLGLQRLHDANCFVVLGGRTTEYESTKARVKGFVAAQVVR